MFQFGQIIIASVVLCQMVGTCFQISGAEHFERRLRLLGDATLQREGGGFKMMSETSVNLQSPMLGETFHLPTKVRMSNDPTVTRLLKTL